uniref:uncharacterized protein LOC122590147 n=1 Tax=Erigeron canadensis TaxID=72917 RepID=UPI001CB8B31A|nr:uncharacterized protein LOC122590147 [Erigeron canadensis]
MSLRIPSFGCAVVIQHRKEHRACPRLNIRAQGLRDEGRSSNDVDSNMKILKHRLEIMRTKERLEMSSRSYGWDCATRPTPKYEKQPKYRPTSLSVLMGSALLCAFSAIISHLNL